MFYEREREREAISGTFIKLRGAHAAKELSRAPKLACFCATSLQKIQREAPNVEQMWFLKGASSTADILTVRTFESVTL